MIRRMSLGVNLISHARETLCLMRCVSHYGWPYTPGAGRVGRSVQPKAREHAGLSPMGLASGGEYQQAARRRSCGWLRQRE